MINGVLVERTVKDVTPALRTNSEGLKQVLEELVKQYKKQQDEMEKWKVGATSYVDVKMTLIIMFSCRRRTKSRSCNSNRYCCVPRENNVQTALQARPPRSKSRFRPLVDALWPGYAEMAD